MRNVVGLLLAAAVGIHCSAESGASDSSTAAPELVGDGRAQTDAPAEPAVADGPRPEKVLHTGPATPDFAPLVPESATTHVTSTVTDASGAWYATGTFRGSIVIGEEAAIFSHGDTDVFLLKANREGRLLWVRAIGSGLAESGPRVTLDDDATHVHLVGTTKGRMDCGSGPLPTWSSDTFFFCVYGGDGAPLSGGVFPTGVP